MYKLEVNDDTKHTRLDVFVAEQVPELSRSYIRKLCDTHKITVNGQVQSANYKLKASDNVIVDFDMQAAWNIPEINIPVLYEDEDVLVINKPIGVLTHSKGVFNPEATVATFIQKHWLGPADGERNGIVHRLDRATSGVMICAKNEAALKFLQKQFNRRTVKKTYYAVVSGTMEPSEAIIDMPIARNPRSPKTFHASSLGKPAQTHYQVVKVNEKHTLLKLSPQSGRTHQLRVHLAHLKHPIVGDQFYHGESADRLYLHAESLELTLPNGQPHRFTAPLPKEFKVWMDRHVE